jgi:hypothetical protein
MPGAAVEVNQATDHRVIVRSVLHQDAAAVGGFREVVADFVGEQLVVVRLRIDQGDTVTVVVVDGVVTDVVGRASNRDAIAPVAAIDVEAGCHAVAGTDEVAGDMVVVGSAQAKRWLHRGLRDAGCLADQVAQSQIAAVGAAAYRDVVHARTDDDAVARRVERHAAVGAA